MFDFANLHEPKRTAGSLCLQSVVLLIEGGQGTGRISSWQSPWPRMQLLQASLCLIQQQPRRQCEAMWPVWSLYLLCLRRLSRVNRQRHHFEHRKVDNFEHQRVGGVGWDGVRWGGMGSGGRITSMSMFLRAHTHTHRNSNLIIVPAVTQTQALHFQYRSLWGGERYVSLMCLYVSLFGAQNSLLFGAQSYPLPGAQSEPPTASTR